MKNDSKMMQTQVMKRPVADSTATPALNLGIMQMIDSGEDPQSIYRAITDAACTISSVKAAAIFVPAEREQNEQLLIAKTGEYDFKPSSDLHDGRAATRAAIRVPGANRSSQGECVYFDIICLGVPVGSLVVHSPEGISPDNSQRLVALAHSCSVVFERQKLSLRLQHFVERLEVLNELNQLIVSNVGMQRIARSVARESAFRFSADIAVTLLLNDEGTTLEVHGAYGCSPDALAEFPLESGILSQVLQFGGHLSVSSLADHTAHGIDGIEKLGIRSVEVCGLQIRGETLGAILIGFKRRTALSRTDVTRFEEVCQGAAVAVANARNQERVTSYTEKLEELVETRTQDLAVQTGRAEEANRAKSRFLANMSHELRTPLTAIVGYASVLGDGVFGDVNPKQHEALTAISRSSEHLKELIDDVLNLARIESGKEVRDPKRISLRDTLTQVYKLMLQTAIGKGVTLEVLKLSEEVSALHIFMDRRHFQQIIINLMSNAVKYTPPEGKVWIEVENIVDKVKVAICDTGVGIPKEKMGKLFERFERGEDAYSGAQEGTGIGLNLTKHLVEINGGAIGVESEVGKGSRFWIMMPTASEEVRVIDGAESTNEDLRLDGLSALVVDDNRDTCEVLKQILSSAGATVRTVTSVKDSIDELKKSSPDIVLTDLAIPGESGLDLIKQLKADVTWATLPIIVLSACAFPADRQRAMDSGASDFIAKPFRPFEVVRAARQLTLERIVHLTQHKES